jgi:hypothetical protein
MPLMSREDLSYNRLMAAFPSLPAPPFESPEMQEFVWGRRWGCTTDVGTLRAVLLHRPGAEIDTIDPKKFIPEIGAWGDVEKGWYWRGPDPPDLPKMQAQHDQLTRVLRDEEIDLVFLDQAAPGRTKSCSPRDAVIAVDGGAIVCRLGARIRRGEELPITRTLARIGMPILRTLHGTAILEGGTSSGSTPRRPWWGSGRARMRRARGRWRKCSGPRVSSSSVSSSPATASTWTGSWSCSTWTGRS